ncbi:sensor histidine kinase [Microvirga sp. VF16]|uniref:sensor histidine kinase n=1 Tax=Microvirga sp. VF16 TaxID=2807101 RepID=UPI00193D60CE|nr:histidine kinase dimerization/phosphoacceptor domain -containing protein [Microvirga sp. VF16]QRM34458.1 GAF domain-containing protein [Microvirga sp. VF16]
MPKRSGNPAPEPKRLHEYQRALAAFSRVASAVLPTERLLHYVTARVSRVTHIRHVKVMHYRPDKGDLLLVAGVGWKPGVVGNTTFSLDSASVAGRTMQTSAPVIIEDLPNDPEFRTPPTLREHGIVSVLNVPIRIDGRTWGVLEMDAEEPRSFDEDDVTFLTTMANILGVALLRQETEDKAAETTAEHARQKSFAEVVLREFQHRVKNNLQTIISFLALQRRHASTPEDRDRFVSVMDRVHAIALAQDQLSFETGVSNVEFGDYLRALCANIDPRRDEVTIEVETHRGALLPLDRAVAAGLIVNELVTNSLKYAFDESGGIIRVTFTMAPELGEACLAVEDNGRGMGSPRQGGLGLRLIDAFTTQLDGQVEQEPAEKGTRTCVRFPLPL